jgi:hypothetical protein
MIQPVATCILFKCQWGPEFNDRHYCQKRPQKPGEWNKVLSALDEYRTKRGRNALTGGNPESVSWYAGPRAVGHPAMLRREVVERVCW